MFLFLLFNFTLHPLQVDTAKVYRQQEVVVTATRTPIESIDAPSRVTQVDVIEMRDAGFDDTRSMLSFVGGIFVKNYGPTQIATISMRGTSAEQTLFLFDGTSLNNIQNGQLDLFLVPTNNLGSIEISQGGSSALYGANAVGGVVNLESKTSSDNLVKIDLGGGSYSNQMVGGEVSEGLGPSRIDLMVQRQRGVNDFNFSFDDGTKNLAMKMIGADYVKDMQSLKIALPSSSGVTSLLIQNISANRGTPSAIFDSASVGTARETDKNAMIILKNTGGLGPFDYSASAGFVYSYLRYLNPDTTNNYFNYYDDYYKTLSFQPAAQFSYSKEQFSGSSGIDAEVDRGQSDNMLGVKSRNRIGIFASGEYDLRKNLDLETRLFGAWRYDDYSEFGSSFSPKAGINFKPLRTFPIHLRANVGTSYRVPTFNDLYYAGSGNPNLKPERSTDYDLGVVVELSGNNSPLFADFNFDYYHIKAHDGIVWVPVNELIWVPENMQILSRGIELSAHLNYNSLVTVRGNYSFGKSTDVSSPDSITYEKQLIYIPQEQSSLTIELTPEIYNFTAAIRYVGLRFYTGDNSESLSSYAVTYISASARISAGTFEFLPRISIDDLFDHRYEVVPNYPMPGRTYQLGMSLQFNQDK